MQNWRGLGLVVAAACLLPGGVWAQQPLRWEPTLDSAKRRAAQTNRLVLIHFWADWCPACRRMEAEVFSQPHVAAALQADFVAVKVNADYFPATRRQYGVTALPADVIITPQGQRIEKLQGMTAAAQYVERLRRIAARTKQHSVPAYAQIPAGAAPGGAGRTRPQPAADLRPPSTAPPYSGGRQDVLAQPNRPAPPPAIAQQHGPPGLPVRPGTAAERSPQQPPADQVTSGNPPLGLDGHCPVQLIERKDVWTMGDPRWGAIHRGRTYLFAGPDQQRRFLSDPDRYAPVLSGNDVVLAVQRRQTVPGHRGHGLFFNDRIFLFADEHSLVEFSKRPDFYSAQALEFMRSDGNQKLGVAAQPPQRRY